MGIVMNEPLGATFWPGTAESLQKAQELFAQCGISLDDGIKKVVCPWGRMPFIFIPAPFEVAYMAWQNKWAARVPPFYCQLPGILKLFLKEEILYPIGKWEFKISDERKEISVKDFFPHWILIPLPLNQLEAPGAMTLRWELPVAERFLREIVVLYNGLVYFPPEMSPNFGDIK